MKQKSHFPKQRKHPKTRLRLPDLEFSRGIEGTSIAAWRRSRDSS
jgi:hypothetical protein